jgi:hypothetical protein
MGAKVTKKKTDYEGKCNLKNKLWEFLWIWMKAV